MRMLTKLTLAFLISLPFLSTTSFAVDRKKFIPFNKAYKVIEPGKYKNPRFTRGDSRVNFYVEGNELAGMINPELSTACVLGEFNQIKRRKRYVNILMPDDSIKRLGYANGYGYNLRDSNNVKVKSEAYLFEYDGTSHCIVYSMAVAGQ